MLPVSNVVIQFKNSTAFVKATILLYALAIYAVYISVLNLELRYSLGIILLSVCWYAVKLTPQWPYLYLKYDAQAWWLASDKAVIKYNHLSLRFEDRKSVV